MAEVEHGQFLEALAPGKAVWLTALGRSMWPILRSGDALRVLRCGVEEVARGDIAILQRNDGMLVAHLVHSTEPLATESFLGRRDDPGLRLLGKVSSMRRGVLTVPIPYGGRQALWVLHLTAAAAYQDPRIREAARKLRAMATSPGTVRFRRSLIGEPRTRLLGPGDFGAARVFVSDHLTLSPEILRRQLPTRWQRIGAAAGAFDRRGRMVGFAFLDEYRQERVALDGFWFRYVYVAPIARNMGLAQDLIAELCDAGRHRGIDRVLADVRADNAASLAAFLRLGFTIASAETARVNQVFKARGAKLVALERQLCPVTT